MSYYPPAGGAYPPPQGSQNPYQAPGHGFPGGHPGQQPYSQQPPYNGPPQQPFNVQQQPPYAQGPSQPFPPQQQPYGAPPAGYCPPPDQYQQQSYGAQTYTQPDSPSPGYVPGQSAPLDMTAEAEGLRRAMKGLGTNEAELIRILSRPDPLQMVTLQQTYNHRFMRNLSGDLEKETSGYFREGLLALARGPLDQDAHLLNYAIKGLGTKEAILNDVLIGRNNADIMAIKAAYQHQYHRSLESDVRGDLSLKTERLFDMVLAAQRAPETAPAPPQQMDQDAHELHRATEAMRGGHDAVTVCRILSSKSDGQIRAIASAYQARYHQTLERLVEKTFSGHMRDALLKMVRVGMDRAKSDADDLEAAMKGLGTKDVLLVNRIVRAHWDHRHMDQVKGAYRHFYKKELSARVKGETSGDYQRLMLAMIG